MIVSGKRVLLCGTTALLLASLFIYMFPSHEADAAQITSRSLTLQAGATDGGSKPGGVVKHLFSFTLPTAGAISSIQFKYCTNANIDTGGTCTTPNGLLTTSATLGTQSGVSFTSLVNTTNGAPYVTAASPITIVTSGGGQNNVITIQLLTVTNPDNTNCYGGTLPESNNCTFFVRISTFASTDASGSPIDAGTVAASTSTQIQLTGTMPESLIFCTGQTISVNGGGIPDCSTATTGNITFNQLFSPTATAYASSQMAASTNAGSGYTITVSGATMTSGSNTIAPMTTLGVSNIGVGQFGLNLAADTDPPSSGGNALVPYSAAVNPAPNGTNYMGATAAAPNHTPDFSIGGNAATAKFFFNNAALNTVAASDNGTGTGHPTDAQIYTTTYMVNVSGSQQAGTYVTTLTYICTPQF